MSLLEALAEAVVNVSASKGGSALTKGDGAADSLFGQMPAKSGGGLEDMLGAILGGSSGAGGRPTDGLGGLLEQLAGGHGGSGGGLDDILGKLSGAVGGSGAAQGGALGGLLGAVAGALQQGAAASAGGGDSFGGILNQAISNRGTGTRIPSPTVQQEAAAGLMLRAMIQAAKSDGKFDKTEQSKLLSKLGDVSAAERDFVNSEMAKPVDAGALARDVPRGLEPQVYAMSVLAIDLDNKNEAQYLHQLAQAFGMGQDAVNHIHSKVGAPALYR